MISLKNIAYGVGIFIAGMLGTIVIFPRQKHYTLHSPQNLARLARGREIRRKQQLQQSAIKREAKRERLREKLRRL